MAEMQDMEQDQEEFLEVVRTALGKDHTGASTKRRIRNLHPITGRFRDADDEAEFLSSYYWNGRWHAIMTAIGLVLNVMSSFTSGSSFEDPVVVIGIIGQDVTSIAMFATFLLIAIFVAIPRCRCCKMTACLGEAMDVLLAVFSLITLVFMYFSVTGNTFVRSETSLVMATTLIVLSYRVRVFPWIVVLCLVVAVCDIGLNLYSLGSSGWTITGVETGFTLGVGDILIHVASNVSRLVFSVCVAATVERTARGLYAATKELEENIARHKKTKDCQAVLVENLFITSVLEELPPKGRAFVKKFHHVGVLVNDIGNFSSFSEALSGAEVFDFLNIALTVFDKAALKRGVVRIKAEGDSWIGISHGARGRAKKSALTCIHAACDMTEEFQAVSSMCTQDSNLYLRTGIAVGDVLVSAFWDDTGAVTPHIFGETADVARRLEPLAGKNEVLCTERTRNLARCIDGSHKDDVTVSSLEFHVHEVDGDDGDHMNLWTVTRQHALGSESVLTDSMDESDEEYHSSSRHTYSSITETRLTDPGKVDDLLDLHQIKSGKCPWLCNLWHFFLSIMSHMLCGVDKAFDETYYKQRLPLIRVNFVFSTIFVGVCMVALIFVPNPMFSVVGLVMCVFSVALSIAGILLSSLRCSRDVVRVVVTMEQLCFMVLYVVGLIIFTWACSVFPMTKSEFILMLCVFDSMVTITMSMPSVHVVARIIMPVLAAVPVLIFGTVMVIPVHVLDWGFSWVLYIVWIVFYNGYLFKSVSKQEKSKKIMHRIEVMNEQNAVFLQGAIPEVVGDKMAGDTYEGAIMYVHFLHANQDTSQGPLASVNKLVSKVNMEPVTRIKASGNIYIAVTGIGGLWQEGLDDILKVANRIIRLNQPCVIGLHYGRFHSGVCGYKPRCYDVLGDSINVAARLTQWPHDSCLRVSEDFVKSPLLSAKNRQAMHIVGSSTKLKGREQRMNVYTYGEN